MRASRASSFWRPPRVGALLPLGGATPAGRLPGRWGPGWGLGLGPRRRRLLLPLLLLAPATPTAHGPPPPPPPPTTHHPTHPRTHTGDRITGRISREELAGLVAAALGTPAAAGKTAELRRQEAADAAGRSMSERDTLR